MNTFAPNIYRGTQLEHLLLKILRSRHLSSDLVSNFNATSFEWGIILWRLRKNW